jgi:hypothetical protein
MAQEPPGGTSPPSEQAAAPARRPRNGFGTAALVFGVIAMILAMVPVVNWFTWPLGVLAIIFGAVGWTLAGQGLATNKSTAIAGVGLGTGSFLLLCLVYTVLFG